MLLILSLIACRSGDTDTDPTLYAAACESDASAVHFDPRGAGAWVAGDRVFPCDEEDGCLAAVLALQEYCVHVLGLGPPPDTDPDTDDTD